MTMRANRRPLVVGVTGLLLALGFGLIFLRVYGDISGFIRIPETDERYVQYANERLGPVVLAPQLGHDGRFFFVLANDPWLQRPAENASLLEHPTYRAQRILYPMLASAFGLLGPTQIVWTLVIWNVIAMAIGVWATARVAVALGGTPWLGLAFLLNPGLIYELAIDGGSIVGMALAFWGLAEVVEGRVRHSLLLFALAPLARETMWFVAAGCAVFLWKGHRRMAGLMVASATVPALVWAILVRARLDVDPSPFLGSFTTPLHGLVSAIPDWIERGGLDLAVGSLIVISSIVVLWKAVAGRNVLAWSTVGFVLLLLILHPVVLDRNFDASRAVAPLLTAAIVLLGSRVSSIQETRL
jgi:hypothetical protein